MILVRPARFAESIGPAFRTNRSVGAHRARTGRGGEIDNQLTEQEARQHAGGYALQTSLGDGSGGIRLVSVNGEIRLERD